MTKTITKTPDYAITARRVGWQMLGVAKLFLVPALFLIANHAFAAGGMDTSSETWNNVHTWLSTWVPLACGAVIVVLGIGWGVFHAIPGAFAGRAIIGMLIAGSASYIVSLTGFGST